METAFVAYLTAFVAYLTAFGAGDTACLEPGTVDTAYGAYLRAFGAGDTAFFGAWLGGHSLWSLDRKYWSVAAEDLLGLCTAPGTCQVLMILASSALLSAQTETSADSRIALLQMQHLLLWLMQQPAFGMLHGHTSLSCILFTLVILCTCCLDCKRLRWPWCYFNTTMVKVLHALASQQVLITSMTGNFGFCCVVNCNLQQ